VATVLRAAAAAVLWAATWGVGVAIGVALGGWLTVIGGAGTPGVGALDITQDVIVLPGLAGIAVMAVHFLGQAVVGLWRLRTSRVPDGQNEHS